MVNPRRQAYPQDPGYNWVPYDSLIDQAAANGIRVEMTLTGPAPAWATSNHRSGVYKPGQAVRKFVRDVAAHFKGRVDRYRIWNEPNWKSWLEPHERAHIYSGLYRARTGHQARGLEGQVLIGETSPQAGAARAGAADQCCARWSATRT